MADFARTVSVYGPFIHWPAPLSHRRLLDEVAYDRVKRGLDLVICLLVLPVVLPIVAMCALAVRLSSPGPVFVSVPRTGKGGRRFDALLLRTARMGPQEPLAPAAEIAEPSEEMIEYARATGIGRILREMHLDELPQLVNVFRGEMSIVGPRPISVEPEGLPLWHTTRLEAHPGLTGPWRLAGWNDPRSADSSRLDIGYVRDRSMSKDAVILLHTLRAIISSGRRGIKRLIDIVGAGSLLLLLAPLMLVIAVAIARTSPGPILFRQRRIGKHGRNFMIMKFRTMRADAEAIMANDPEMYATYVANGNKLLQEIDPRITPLGRWLRRTSLDELPQLINILRGEMSLVGPRPILPDEVVHYGARIPRFCSVAPGLTGAWQVAGRSALPYPGRCDIELNYVSTWSLTQDAEILFKTVGTVISGRGAT